MNILDSDSNQVVFREEFMESFEKLFYRWAGPDSSLISYEELEDGFNSDISPRGPNPLKNKNRE
jgi:hypothetical protein